MNSSLKKTQQKKLMKQKAQIKNTNFLRIERHTEKKRKCVNEIKYEMK